MIVSTRAVVATVFVFAVAFMCVRLGFWQLERLEQRRARNEAVEARRSAAPVELTRTPRDSTGWLQRRVVVRGRLDHARSIILPGRAYQGVPGAHVLTPVLLPAGGAVLADRGWVEAADGASVNLDALPRVAEIADTAVVLPFPGHEASMRRVPPQAFAAAGFRRVWFAIEESALRGQFPYELGATHVRLLPATTAPAAPLREPLAGLEAGPHLGYAIQWFSFAAIAIIGWAIVLVRSKGEGEGEGKGENTPAPQPPRPSASPRSE